MTIDLQALMDGMGQKWQKERADTQMTLGKMIAALEAMQLDSYIEGIENPHSYRGYYTDLAFERTGRKLSVADALKMCRNAMGKVFEGYKGGDFVMGELTPVWLSEYGTTGDKIMGISPDGTFETAEDEF